MVAIDPGTDKCGLAVLDEDTVVVQEVVSRQRILGRLEEVLADSGPIVLGDRTGSKQFMDELALHQPDWSERVVLIDEHRSSDEARVRYWVDHRPRGWQRLLPTSFLVPPEPIDDYVAVILAERFQNKYFAAGF